MTTPPPQLDVEQGLVNQGFTVVIGLDEVGRGALAGPVTVGAVAWWPGAGEPPEGIRDSKLVPEKLRARQHQNGPNIWCRLGPRPRHRPGLASAPAGAGAASSTWISASVHVSPEHACSP